MVHTRKPAHNVQHRRCKQHDEDAGEDAEDQRENDFNLRLCGSLFRGLLSLGPDLLRKSGERFCDRRAKFVRLREHADKRAELLDLRSLGEVLPGFESWPAGALLPIDLSELIVDVRMTDREFLPDAEQRLVEAKSRFDADHHKIKGVGNATPNALTAPAHHPVQPHIWRKITGNAES